MQFEIILKRVVSHEGGYTDDKDDPGNWTGGKVGVGELKGSKYGISAASYPHLDIRKLSWEKAKEIYWQWYRDCKLYNYRAVMQYQLFDSAFNHGITRTNKLLQATVGATQDGIVGKNTLAAVAEVSDEDIVLLFLATRLQFFTDISHFTKYGRGWSRRIAQNLRYAAEDN